jgi:transcriptional regulator with XRE-family HTH domain
MGIRPKPSPEEMRVIERVSSNVRRLMQAMDWSEHDLAKKSGVSQKAINNLLNQVTGCTVTTAEKLAHAFGLTSGWQLMIEEVPQDAAFGNTLNHIVVKFLRTDDQGRDFIRQAADRV